MSKEIIVKHVGEERIYLKKSKVFGWGVVNPYKIDGKINWKNLLIGGNWINPIIVLIVVIVVLGCLNEYSNVATLANECLNENPFKILVN